MKQFLIVTNLITAAAVVYLLAKPFKPETMPPLPSAIAPDCNLRKDYTDHEVPGLISIQAAQMISEAYAKDAGKKYVTIDNVITEAEDARCIRFGFEKIKSYIWQIEQRFCGRNCDSLKLGMRFYYAKYPDKALCDSLGVDKKYAMKHTVFMVPTYFDGQRHVDFDPFYFGQADICKPTPLSELVKNKGYLQKKPMVIMAIADGDVDNHGGLMPPPAGTGTFPSN